MRHLEIRLALLFSRGGDSDGGGGVDASARIDSGGDPDAAGTDAGRSPDRATPAACGSSPPPIGGALELPTG